MPKKVHATRGTVKSVYKRSGDLNPKVEVRGVELTTGERFETCQAFQKKVDYLKSLPNSMISQGHSEYQNPHEVITEIAVGTEIIVFYGDYNGYPHPTFVGYY